MRATTTPSPDPFAERRKVQVGIDAELIALVEAAFSLRIARPHALVGGEEAAVWKVEANGTNWVVRVSPAWRLLEDLEKVYHVVVDVARLLPEVPAPLHGKVGTRVIAYQGHPVSIHPFVDGDPLDRNDPAQRAAAARLLARLHAALAGRGRNLGAATEPFASTSDDPPALRDPDLDFWLAALPNQPWHRSLIHGDYYPRNLLWANDRITGVLDWDELVADYREQEVAWSIWEFCQNDGGTGLNLSAAIQFLDDYVGAGGTVANGFGHDAARFIRRRMRRECRAALAARTRGEPFDAAYFEAEVTAFANLRGLSLA